MAALEEFIQEKYVENFETLSEKENKALGLIELPETSTYFYKPNLEGTGGGALKYIVDSEGHALYLINKDGLPKEIRDVLVGGEAGNKEYSDYIGLKDVYGVNSNLDVYYCEDGIGTLSGISKENLDFEDESRELFPASSPFAGLLGKESGENVTLSDVKGIPNIEIDGNTFSSDLTDIYNLVALQKLVLKNYKGSLKGIENTSVLKEVRLENCVITDYSALGKLGTRLQKLYLYDVNDEEVGKMLSKDSTGIGTYDLPNLKYFGVVGNTISLDWNNVNGNSSVYGAKYSKKISSSLSFDELTETTKNAVNYLYVNNNELADLSGFINYKNVVLIRAEYNKIQSLNGLQEMKNLKYIEAKSNELGINESNSKRDENTDSISYIKNISLLKFLDLSINQIIYIDYIKDLKNLNFLFLDTNPKFSTSSIANIAELYLSLVGYNKSIDDIYKDYLKTSENFAYKNLERYSENYNYLIGLDKSVKLKVKYLTLYGSSSLLNDDFNTILSDFDNLEELDCTGCTNLTTLGWLSGKTKLKQFLFENTGITGDEVSKIDQFATSLCSFKCNNENINLSRMQDAISRTSAYYGIAGYAGYLGCGITNSLLAEKLSLCDKITQINLNGCKSGSNGYLDLTNCSSLTEIYLQGGGVVILPSSCNYLSGCYMDSQCFDLRNLKGKTLYIRNFGNLDPSGGKLLDAFDQFVRYNVTLPTLKLSITSGKYLNYDLLSKINEINCETLIFGSLSNQENFKFVESSWSGTLLNVKSLHLFGTSLNNLNFLQDNMQLESLSLINCKISDISGLKCYSSLKNLILSNNQISNLENLSLFTELGKEFKEIEDTQVKNYKGYLDLSGNPIWATIQVGDKTVNNIQELVKLKKSDPNLNQIILIPNDFIADDSYKPLKELGWDKATGKFNS